MVRRHQAPRINIDNIPDDDVETIAEISLNPTQSIPQLGRASSPTYDFLDDDEFDESFLRGVDQVIQQHTQTSTKLTKDLIELLDDDDDFMTQFISQINIPIEDPAPLNLAQLTARPRTEQIWSMTASVQSHAKLRMDTSLGFALPVKISDASMTIDAFLSNPVVEQQLGMTLSEVNRIKGTPEGRARILESSNRLTRTLEHYFGPMLISLAVPNDQARIWPEFAGYYCIMSLSNG